MLDQMAQRYGLLPSKVLTDASTFDMVIMDISLSVEQYAKNKDQEGFIPPVTTEDLLKIKERSQ